MVKKCWFFKQKRLGKFGTNKPQPTLSSPDLGNATHDEKRELPLLTPPEPFASKNKKTQKLLIFFEFKGGFTIFRPPI